MAQNSPIGQRTRIVLKGVDVSEVISALRNGVFARMPIPMGKPNFPADALNYLVKPAVTQSPGNHFLVCLPQYGKICYQSTATEAYQTFSNTGQPLIGGCCSWCRRDFSHYRLGIPVRAEESFGELPAGIPVRKDRKILVVYYEACNCSYECALAELKFRKKAGMGRNANYYDDSESLLKAMFHASYPGKVLHPADDYLTLKRFGGWKSDEEFHSDSHFYQPTTDLVLFPAQLIFQQVQKS